MFQSTPPTRAATVWRPIILLGLRFQSTPPTRAATGKALETLVSTTSFQSTPPTRGATQSECSNGPAIIVSIHATPAGGDDVCQHRVTQRGVSIHATHAGGDPPWYTWRRL